MANDDRSKRRVAAARVVPPKPPNGGWGWVVVAASFLSNFIVDGTLYTFGIFFVELLASFNSSKTTTSFVGSVLGGMYLMVGPIVGALANKFGCRAMSIFGSVLAAVFFFISSYSSSIEVLLVTYGIMGGIGFGFMYLPSIVMVGMYFDTKRAMATGIAVCGSGFGTFLIAPIARKLLDEYGWRGANKILAGFILHGVACGLVYRPLETKLRRPLKSNSDALVKDDDAKEKVVIENSANDDVQFQAAQQELKEAAARPLNRQDVLYQGSVQNLNEYKASPDMDAYINSVTSIPTNKKRSCLETIKDTVMTMFDFSLFLSPTFLVVCLSGVCGFLGFFTPFVYINDFAIAQGASQNQASLLLSVIGIGNVTGRLLSGWLADRPWADSLLIHNVAAILAGAATCLVPVLLSTGLLFAYSAFFGLTLAAFIALRSIVLCDLLGVQKLTNAFGIVSLFQGIALLIGTPFSGYIFDSTGSYTWAFIISGIILALAGVVCWPARRIALWEKNRTQRNNSTEASP